jgi:hypothetical protein
MYLTVETSAAASSSTTGIWGLSSVQGLESATEWFCNMGRHHKHDFYWSCKCGSGKKNCLQCLAARQDVKRCCSWNRTSPHPIYFSIYLSTDLSFYLFIYLSIDLSIHLSIYQSINLSIYPSTHLSIYLSIYACMYVCMSCIYAYHEESVWEWYPTIHNKRANQNDPQQNTWSIVGCIIFQVSQ